METSTDINFSELSEQNSGLLRQFAFWLNSLEKEPFVSDDEREPEVGLYQLFEALAAQRQELKSYTKSGRQTQELLQRSIEETSKAVESLSRFRKDRPETERKAVMPFLTSLIEIDESLQRVNKALKSLQDRLTDLSRSRIETVAGTYCDTLSVWSRFWLRNAIHRFAEYLIREQTTETELLLEPFRVGFEILLERMDDVLKKHSMKRLNPLGEPVNPETMQVVAVVASETIEPGCVAETIRFGYLWRGKPIRFADVRAAQIR